MEPGTCIGKFRPQMVQRLDEFTLASERLLRYKPNIYC